MRKTVNITTVLERGNYFLKNSEPDKRAAREATANFMETLLHDADAYAGFGYLDSAGVDHDAPKFTAKDESRRHYCTHKGLRPRDYGRTYP